MVLLARTKAEARAAWKQLQAQFTSTTRPSTEAGSIKLKSRSAFSLVNAWVSDVFPI
jgi:hypothetical protein